MRNMALAVLAVVFILSGCSPFAASGTGQAGASSASEMTDNTDTQISVTFDRVASYTEDEEGNILAEMYFDKPVLSGNSETAQKINAYFDAECTGFFDGSDQSAHFKDGLYDQFAESVESMRGIYGDDAFIKSPLYSTVKTEIVYMSPDILSVKESQEWMAGGAYSYRCYGATFDLETGALLPADHFIDADIETFNGQVISLLYDYLSEYGVLGITDREAFNENWEAGITNRDIFEDEHMRKTFEDYEYYFDGADIWLIFHEYSQMDNSYVIQYID